MNSDVFTVDQIGWHTRVPGNPETREEVVARFCAIVQWLQLHELTTRTLLHSQDELNDSFSIRSDDLTEVGLAVMRAAYSRWVDGVGRGKPVSDVATLDRALKKALAVRGDETGAVQTRPKNPRKQGDS